MLGKLVHIESEGFASSTETNVVVKKRFLSTEEDGRLGNKLNRAIATRCIEEEESSRFRGRRPAIAKGTSRIGSWRNCEK